MSKFNLFKKQKNILNVIVNEDNYVNDYKYKITHGKMLQNEDIETILKMNINNIRLILEIYNKTVYAFAEFIQSK